MYSRVAEWLRRSFSWLLIGACLSTFLGCDYPRDPEPLNDSKGTVPSSQGSTPADTRLNQTFAAATRSEPPVDFHKLPDRTLTGKSIGKLYTELTAIWPTIELAGADGKLLPIRAILETDLGTIEISLRPDLAPNHVRNFIALARLGYYDGLVFERAVRVKPPDKPEVEILEAGCPLGTGDQGIGNLGYWLKSELSTEHFEAGSVGAPHGSELDSAGPRFFITLNQAPFLDRHFTIFGKVSVGIDVARRIFSLPISNDPGYPEGDRPEKPVVIRKIWITSAPAEPEPAR